MCLCSYFFGGIDRHVEFKCLAAVYFHCSCLPYSTPFMLALMQSNGHICSILRMLIQGVQWIPSGFTFHIWLSSSNVNYVICIIFNVFPIQEQCIIVRSHFTGLRRLHSVSLLGQKVTSGRLERTKFPILKVRKFL